MPADVPTEYRANPEATAAYIAGRNQVKILTTGLPGLAQEAYAEGWAAANRLTVHRGIQVRYCTPEDCTEPECANYAPEVPAAYAYAPTEWRAGYRHEAGPFSTTYPGPERMAHQAGWVAGNRRALEERSKVRRALEERSKVPSHTFPNGVDCWDTSPIIWTNSEDCLHEDAPDHPAGTCLPLCPICTAILEASHNDR